MTLPLDRSFDDPTDSSILGSYLQLYHGSRFATGSNFTLFLPREGRLCKVPDGYGARGVAFDSADSAARIAGVAPRLETAETARVSAWLRYLRIQGEAASPQFVRTGVFARGSATGAASAETPDPYTGLTGMEALAFILQPEDQPGTFRFALERWNSSGFVELGSTAVYKQFEQTLFKPMGMRLRFENDTGTTATAICEIKDTKVLEPIEAATGGPGNPGTSPLGINGSFIKDYDTLAGIYRANLMRGAREWVTQDIGTNDLVEKGHAKDLKPDGLPNSIPTVGTTLGTVLFRDVLTTGVDTDPLPVYRSGTYVVEWKGGLVELDSSATYDVSSVAGAQQLPDGGRRVEFDVDTPSTAGIYLRITVVDPGGMEYLRVFHKDDEAVKDAEPWDPEVLKDLSEYFSVLRLMDFTEANNNDAETKDDLLDDDYLFWTGDKGMPYSWQIALANRLQINPWFCMPPKLDSEGRTVVLEQIRDNLDPGLVAYLERGNEFWLNLNYLQTVSGQPDAYVIATDLIPGPFCFDYSNDTSPHPTLANAVQIGSNPLDSNPFTACYIGMGKLAQELFDDVNTVFAGQMDRVVRVAGSQFANDFVTEKVLENAPDADAVAVAPYVPGTPSVSYDYSPSVADIFTDLRTEFPTVRTRIQDQKAKADEFGVRLIAYEWGQQLISSSSDLVKMMTVQVDALMQSFIQDLYAIWNDENGTEIACFFNSHQKGTVDGQYGFRRFPGQLQSNAPKARALAAIAEATSVVGTAQALSLENAGLGQGKEFVGYTPVTVTQWKKVLEVSLTGANYLDDGEAYGIFGDVAQELSITNGQDKQWAAMCTRLLLERESDDTVLWNDDFSGRVDALCGTRSLVGLGDCYDYGSEFSGDIAGYGLGLTSDPYTHGYNSTDGEIRISDSDARGFEVYQRPADDRKSQHRRLTAEFVSGSSGDSTVGLAQRVEVAPPASSGADLQFQGYLFLIKYDGTDWEAEVRRILQDGSDLLMGTATPTGLSVGTAFTMDLSIFDAFSTGTDGPVAMIPKVNGSTLTWTLGSSVGEQIKAYTGNGLVDISSSRITQGRYEGFYAKPNGYTLGIANYAQQTLVGEGPPIADAVPSLSWGNEAADASGTLSIPVDFQVRQSPGGDVQAIRTVSGRRRTASEKEEGRDPWGLQGVVDQTTLDAILALHASNGTEVPFTLDLSSHFPEEASGLFRFLRNGVSYRRLRTRFDQRLYVVELSLIRQLDDA